MQKKHHSLADRRQAKADADAKYWRSRSAELKAADNARRRQRRANKHVPTPHMHEHDIKPCPRALHEREVHLERMIMLPCDPNIMLLGDPPPWRSALGRHHGADRIREPGR